MYTYVCLYVYIYMYIYIYINSKQVNNWHVNIVMDNVNVKNVSFSTSVQGPFIKCVTDCFGYLEFSFFQPFSCFIMTPIIMFVTDA